MRMPSINTIMLTLLLALFAYFFNQNIGLKEEVSNLKDNQTKLLSTNAEFKSILTDLNDNYQNELVILSELKNKKEKEVHYVTTIKEHIIHDKNSTCIDAINNIYARLHEQANTDSNTSENTTNP